MCDEGRFGFKYIHDDSRIKRPIVKDAVRVSLDAAKSPSNGNGKLASDLSYADPWIETLALTRRAIAKAIGKNASGFTALLSPMMTVEEAYLLANYLKSLNKSVRLAMGPVPEVGVDDVYPKDPKGKAVDAKDAKFIIRAEKAPNRRGVEMVLKHFEGKVISFNEVVNSRSQIEAIYIVGGYPPGWVTDKMMQLTESIGLVIVQDILTSGLTERADIVLAGGSFLEKDGCFINYKSLVQAVKPAIRSPGDARQDGRVLMELCERKGLYNARVLRQEIAAKIPSLAALAIGDLGENGISLATKSAPSMAMT